MDFDQWMKATNPKYRKSDDTEALRLLRSTWVVAREAACAEIKAADDKASQSDYMLDSMTKEEAQAKQDWKGMDGAIAFHLIERHADGWNQISMMMDAWLEANRVPNI